MQKSYVLTDVVCRGAKYPAGRKGPYLLADGGGLNLQLMPSGTKSWILRYMLGGRAKMLGLGPYPTVSLAAAREEASKWRKFVKQGVDPSVVRKTEEAATKQAELAAVAKAVTFERATHEFLETHSVAWRNAKHRAQWVATLSTYAVPVIGAKAVGEIGIDHVEAVLKPIWTKLPETASRVRGRLEHVLDFAESRGWRAAGPNPAAWKAMKHRLPNVAKNRLVEHHPALPWPRVAEFMAALEKRKGIAAKVLSFAILTAARSGEARGARWNEIDLDGGVWTVPASRMKAAAEHRVVLSTAAISLLEQLKPLARGPDSLVFPSTRAGKVISDMSMTMLIRGMNEPEPVWLDIKGRPIVMHGFRSSFRDWAEEATATPRAVVERALAHKVPDAVEAAYLRSDLLEKRKALMEQWAQQCSISMVEIARKNESSNS